MSGTHQTMAALARTAAERFGDRPATRAKRDGSWHDTSYDELWQQVRAVALGLIGLGIQAGDRVCILADTSHEFTVADLAVSSVGGVVVPVYPSNSPDECQWVVGDSGATAIFCADASQTAKIDEVRAGLPDLAHVIVLHGAADPATTRGATTLADVAAGAAQVDPAELDRRIDAARPDDACLIIYTSGTTGRPKGVVLTNKGFAAGRQSAADMQLMGPGDVIYLYLPLAHVFAQLVQADAIELGSTLAYFTGDTRQIVPELGEVKPHVLPSVPRIFEKVYALATGHIGDIAKVQQAVELGLAVREAERAGREVPEQMRAAFAEVDALFGIVRGLFGGNVKLAISGAAPIAAEILRFFYAAGVPVFEGWGMTETTSIGTLNLPDAYRFGSIGQAVAGAQIRIADDGEIELHGEMVLREYWRNPQATADTMTADGWLRTGDLGSIDDDGFVYITGRKKDIIITAGGKNLTPANLEGALRQSRWIANAVMYGDRRPYPVALVTLDPEEIVPWATANGLPTDLAELAIHPQVVEMIQGELDTANKDYAQVEQIKKFTILDHDLSQDRGELTPTLKVKRNVIYDRYADLFEAMYR